MSKRLSDFDRQLLAKRRQWRRDRSREESARFDNSVDTEAWWRLRCRQMHHPDIPPTPREYRLRLSRMARKLTVVFMDSLAAMINRPCILPSLLSGGGETGTVKWS